MLKILLADDSNVAQRMGKEILSAEGYEVLTVSNGQAAMKKLSEFLPDLVIADIFMPGTSGYELCQFVKSDKHPRHVPVVLLVGAMEPYDPDEGRRVRADGIVTKPLQASSLLKIVKSLLVSVKPADPPAPKKEKVYKAAAVNDAGSKTDVVDASLVAAVEEPPLQAVVEKIEIPKEMAEQPMSAFSELLEPLSLPAASAEPTSAVEPLLLEQSASLAAAGALTISEELPAYPVQSESESTPAEAVSNEPTVPFELSSPPAETEVTPPTIEFPQAPTDAADEPAATSIFPSFPGETSAPAEEAGPQMAMPERVTPTETMASSAETALAIAAIDASLVGLLDAPELPETSVQLEAAQSPVELMPKPEAAASIEAPVQTTIPTREVSWIAEAVEVTEEEAKLFVEPKVHWEELSKIAELGEAPILAEELAAPLSAIEEKLAETIAYVPDAEALPDPVAVMQPHSLDAAEIERLVREAIDEMMPQIVDRIARTVEVSLRREKV